LTELCELAYVILINGIKGVRRFTVNVSKFVSRFGTSVPLYLTVRYFKDSLTKL